MGQAEVATELERGPEARGLGLEASLREESYQVKQCFNDYAFKTLTFSSAVLAAVAGYQRNYPLVGLGTLPLIALLLVVARIGTHKYGTSNRIDGYLLHLERIRRLQDAEQERPAEFMLSLGWQEAMRAWRVVQATVFEKIYQHGRWRLNIANEPFSKRARKWFEPPSLLARDTAWHSGGFLGNVLFVLHFFCIIALAPLIALCVQEGRADPHTFSGAFPCFLSVTALISLAVLFRIRKTRVRRNVLENGLLSINSCALMWHAVVVAHYRALEAMRRRGGGTLDSYEGYIRLLSLVARDLSKHLRNDLFHAWLTEREDERCLERVLGLGIVRVLPDKGQT